MANKQCKRRQLFVDPKVQGGLIVRVVMYWVFCLMGITLMLLCWRIVTGPARPFYTHFEAMWFHFGPALIASFVLLPMVIIDVVRYSNRFVGPMLRLKRSMRQLAHGEDVERLEFRNADFWQEVAVDFNAIRERLPNAAASAEHRPDEAEHEEPLAVG